MIPEILNKNGIVLIDTIKANMTAAGQNATGKTAQSLRIEIKQEGTKYRLTVLGRPFFRTIQTGRGPTKPGSPLSYPSLLDQIKEWMEAKGIAGSPWGITQSIHQTGTKLWRQGGRTDIIEPATDDLINNVAQDLLDAKADDLVLKIREMKW